MNARNQLGRTLATLILPLGLAACVAEGPESSEIDGVYIAEEAQGAAMAPGDEIISGGDDHANATTEANAGGCLTYVGVITVKEYECPCWITDYYDRFYNNCNGTYSDTFLYQKSSCNTKYGYICP